MLKKFISFSLFFFAILPHSHAEELKCPPGAMSVDFVLSFSQERMQVCQKEINGKFQKEGLEIVYNKDGTIKSKVYYHNDVETSSPELSQSILADDNIIRTLNGHSLQLDNIWDSDFSQDGKYLVTSGNDLKIIIWDRFKAKPSIIIKAESIKNVQGSIDGAFVARFSPDSSMIATGYADGTIKLYDVHTGKIIHSYKIEEDILAYSQIAYLQFIDGYLLVRTSNYLHAISLYSGKLFGRFNVAMYSIQKSSGFDAKTQSLVLLTKPDQLEQLNFLTKKNITSKKLQLDLQNGDYVVISPNGLSHSIVRYKTGKYPEYNSYIFELWDTHKEKIFFESYLIKAQGFNISYSKNGLYVLTNTSFMDKELCNVIIYSTETGKSVLSKEIKCKWANVINPSEDGHSFVYLRRDDQVEMVTLK